MATCAIETDAQTHIETIVEKAKDIVHQNYTRPVGVSEIAQMSCVSPQHLRRAFRTVLATSPSRYLWQVRAEKGVALLQETALSVAEAVHTCGFQNPYHFSRLVKRIYGKAPSKLRTKE